jgi:hypothetical protein
MGKAVLGKITCPHCGSEDATVHEQASRSARLYYRCMDGPHGPCGTIQCTLPGGQKFIRDNMRPLNGVEIDAAHEAAEVAREEQTKAATTATRKKSFMDTLFGDDDA